VNGVSEVLLRALGWTFVHALWECGALGLVAWAGLGLLRRKAPQVRYAFALAILLLMGLSSLLTFSLVWGALREAGFGLRPWQAQLLPWLPTLAWAWMLGAAAMLLRLGWGLGYLYGFGVRGVEAPEPAWEARLVALARRMGIHQKVRLRLAAWADSPLVLGWLRPMILVPPAAFLSLRPEALEAVLLHELAHILRRDFLVNLMQSFLEALLFFHPAVWWVSQQIRLEREHCCDDLAAACAGDTLDYAQALVELERLRAGNPFHAELAPAARGGSLMLRIRRLLQPQSPAAPLGMKGALFLLLASGAVAVAGARSGRTEAQALPTVQVDESAPIFLPQAPPEPVIQVTQPSPDPVIAPTTKASVKPLPTVATALPVSEPLPSVLPEPIPAEVAPSVVTEAKANIPLAWTVLPLRMIPVNARTLPWTGRMGDGINITVMEPHRLQVEVPPQGSFRAQLKGSWDSPVQLAVQQDAAWKMGLRVSRKDQSYTNRKSETQIVRVSLTQSIAQDVSVFGSGGGGPHWDGGSWPYRVDFTRNWDIEAWRAARKKLAPAQEGLAVCQPGSLSPAFVPPLPSLPADPEAHGLAEVALILDADGHPLSVEGGTGHPALVAAMSEWAWQLAFEPGKGLPAQGAVSVPLRLNFQRDPLNRVPPTVKYQPPALNFRPPLGAQPGKIAGTLETVGRFQGAVIVQLLVGTDGVPSEVKVLSGPVDLRPMAIEHAKQWRFNPATLNGKPAPAYYKLELPFRLK